MQDLLSCLFPNIFFGALFVFGVMYFGDYTVRRRRAKFLNTLHSHTEIIQSIEAFASWEGASPTRARFTWMRAEIFITEDCLYYFGYQKTFGRRMYRNAIQIALPNVQSPKLLFGLRYYLMQSTEYSNGVWKLHFRRSDAGLLSPKTTVLLSDLDLDAVDIIKEFCQRVENLSANEITSQP